MKKIVWKSKLKRRLYRDVAKFSWAEYKVLLKKVNSRPAIDYFALQNTKLLIDIFLLEEVVEAHDYYFLFQLDYEHLNEESSKNNFGFFIDSLNALYNSKDVVLSLSDKIPSIYNVPTDIVDLLLFFNDEDFITQFYYKFFFWGPLELVYHNVYADYFHLQNISLIRNFGYKLVVFTHKLEIYFKHRYGFEHVFKRFRSKTFVFNFSYLKFFLYRFREVYPFLDFPIFVTKFSSQFKVIYKKDKLPYYSPLTIICNKFIRGFEPVLKYAIVYYTPYLKNTFKLLLYWLTSKTYQVMFFPRLYFYIFLAIYLRI